MYRISMNRISAAAGILIAMIFSGTLFGYSPADTNVYTINQNFFHEGYPSLYVDVAGTASDIAVIDRTGAVRGRPVFDSVIGSTNRYKFTAVPALNSGTYFLYLRIGNTVYRRPFIVYRAQQ